MSFNQMDFLKDPSRHVLGQEDISAVNIQCGLKCLNGFKSLSTMRTFFFNFTEKSILKCLSTRDRHQGTQRNFSAHTSICTVKVKYPADITRRTNSSGCRCAC